MDSTENNTINVSNCCNSHCIAMDLVLLSVDSFSHSFTLIQTQKLIFFAFKTYLCWKMIYVKSVHPHQWKYGLKININKCGHRNYKKDIMQHRDHKTIQKNNLHGIFYPILMSNTKIWILTNRSKNKSIILAMYRKWEVLKNNTRIRNKSSRDGGIKDVLIGSKRISYIDLVVWKFDRMLQEGQLNKN